MSSNARRKGSPHGGSSISGVATLRGAKVRIFAFLTLVTLTAVFSASALTANQTATSIDSPASLGKSGVIASSANSILSYLGLTAEASPADDTIDAGSQRGGRAGCEGLPEGVIACYRAENDASDSTGNHDGVWNGSIAYAAGKVGDGAFNFNGSGVVEVASKGDLNPTSLTVDGWVNLTGDNGTFGLISKGDAYSLVVRGGQVVFMSRDIQGVEETLVSSSRIASGKWVHIAATHDGMTRVLYVDGEEVARGAQNGIFMGDVNGMVIGRTETAERSFGGLADEIKLFGRALTGDEVKVLAGDRPDAPDAGIAFSTAAQTVSETAGVVNLVITRPAAQPAETVTLTLAPAGGGTTQAIGSACSGIAPFDDYVPQSPNPVIISFLANETTKNVGIEICDDTVPEGTETFTATLSGAAPGPLGAPASQVVTILDNDATVTVTRSPAAVVENSGTPIEWTFTRSPGPNNFPITVNFLVGGTASNPGANDDYDGSLGGANPCASGLTPDVGGTGNVVIPANSASCTILTTPDADTRVEPDETIIFTITAGTVSGYVIGNPNTQTGTITNDDFSEVDFIDDTLGTETEGNPGGTNTINYVFDRDQPAGSQLIPLTVNYTLTGVANCNNDYTVTTGGAGAVTFVCGGGGTGTGTITFPGTDEQVTLSVVTTADIVVEPDESVITTIVAGTNTNNGNTYTPDAPNPAFASINDDDEDISVTVAGSPISEAGPGSMNFQFLRNFDSANFAGDGDGSGASPIADPLVVGFSTAGTAVCNSTADYTIGDTGGASSFTYNAGTCTGTINFVGFDNDHTLTFTPTNDNIPENNETVIVTILPNALGAANNYGVGSPNAAPAGTNTATGTITNDDFLVIVQGIAPTSVLEDGADNLTYRFTRIGETANPIVANFNASGSASALNDYTVTNATTFLPQAGTSPGSVTIAGGTNGVTPVGGFGTAGVQTQSFDMIVDPTVDANVEADEEVQIQVDNGVGYEPGVPAQASGIILNDDAEVSVAVAPTAVAEDGAANLVYTFSRTGGCGAALTINYTTAGTANNADYTGTTVGANTVSFLAGQCTTTVTVDPTVDNTVEPDETVVIAVAASGGAPNQYTIAAAPNNSATGTITNDDTDVTVAIFGAAAVNEGNVAPGVAPTNTITYRFTRGGILAGGLSVNYSLTGTASAGDFTGANLGNNVVGFAPGSATADVVITTVADNTVEPDDSLVATVLPGSGYTAGAGTANGTILNDDNDIVCAINGASSVNEGTPPGGGNTITFRCTRTTNGANAAAALSVPYAVTGTSGGGDRSIAPATFAFAGGGNTQTADVTVTTTPDSDVEADETVILTVSSGEAATIGFWVNPNPTAMTGTILNDDNDVNIAVSVVAADGVTPAASDLGAAGVFENGTKRLRYTFTRDSQGAALAQSLDVNFTLATSTACAATPCGDNNPADFTVAGAQTYNAGAGTGTVRFAANSSTVSILVTPTGDAIVEPDETVVVNVAAGANYDPVPGTAATGTILNDDTSYTLTFDGVSGAPVAGEEGDPGDPGETIATFTITRNGANSPAGSVTVATVPGSGNATAGPPNTLCQNATPSTSQDYISDGQVLAFAAGGTTSQTFTIRICRDLFFELTEFFQAQLSNPVGGFLGTTGPVNATIIDDDNAPTLSINDISVNENAGTAVLTVTQSTITALNTSFTFSTTNGTAVAPGDYTAVTSGSGSIPAGSTTTTVSVPIIDDTIDEPNENFTVNLGSPVNAAINDGTGVVTIIDNEPNTKFAISDVVQIEGNPSAVDPTVASTSAFNFNIIRTGDAQASETVCFETVDGDIENPAINPNPATAGPNLGGPNWPNDYNPLVAGPSNCVTFTQGGPSVIVVPVIVYGDPIFEFDEYFTVRLLTVNGVANPIDQDNNARITDRLGLGTIQNDDLVTTYTIAQTSPQLPVSGPPYSQINEGNSGSANVTYTVTRTQTAVAGTVQWATGGGTATAGASCGFPVDYRSGSGTLNFAVGQATATFTVAVCGDTIDENNETFNVTLSNPTFGSLGSPAQVTTTILDDEAQPIITVSDVSACEVNAGETQAFVFTITRNGASDLTSTVTVNTVSGTAVSPGDFVAITGQVVTFNPGETTKTVTVTVNGDNVFETDESFTLQVVAASADLVIAPVGGADPIGLGVIQNNCAGGDPAPSFAVGPVTQAEGTAADGSGAPFFVRLTRTGLTEVPASLTYSTSNGTATGGASCTGSTDYISISNAAINFPANGFSPSVGPPAQGANFIDLPVQVCRDSVFEQNETFNVNLTAVSFAQVAAGGTPALVTITNDDGLSFRVRFPGPEGAEGNGPGTTNFTFTIDRIGDSSVSSNVCYETVNGTATAGSDYVGLPPTTCSTFSSGTMSVNVPVAVNGDTTPEGDETFFLRLVSASAGTIDTEQRLATILNDDGPVVTTGVEGDVVDGSGGPAGDGLVQANDVTAIRNFVLTGTTPATSPNQFQRADVNLPCGNGGIDSGDVTVIRNMILGTTPSNTPACGPAVPVAAEPVDLGRADNLRIIRAVSQTTTPGSTVVVPFQLDSQGNETSLAFTANWNPAVLTFVSAAVGNGVPGGANFGTNTSQTAQGRLGVLIDSTNVYQAGTRQIVTVTFTVAAGATAGTYPITFSGTPTGQSTSDAAGGLLPTVYEPGNVVITITAAGVRVSGRVTTAGGQGLRNATVVLTDSEGNRRTATTGSFGIYTFEDVEAGGTYVVGVQAKRYRFTSRIVNVTDSLTDVDFVGQE